MRTVVRSLRMTVCLAPGMKALSFLSVRQFADIPNAIDSLPEPS
jgi:hypothetical protein